MKGNAINGWLLALMAAGLLLPSLPARALARESARARPVLLDHGGRALWTVRRTPFLAEEGVAAPLGAGRGAGVDIANGDFSSGLDGWSASESGGTANPGGVSAEAGAAVLAEGDSFLVTLQQTFTLPPGAGAIALDIFLTPGFDAGAALIPDAFEVTLLGPSGEPLLAPWDSLATSSFNLQEDGTANTGAHSTWDGRKVLLDITSVPAGTTATLYLDLIGGDTDTGSVIRADNVAVLESEEQGFVRGNSNNDDEVNISDAVYTLGFLFLGRPAPVCLDAADSNNDSAINITDPIYALNFLFLGGPIIPPPFPLCGLDEGPDDLLGCGPAASCPGGP
jgi:hypothetical protein